MFSSVSRHWACASVLGALAKLPAPAALASRLLSTTPVNRPLEAPTPPAARQLSSGTPRAAAYADSVPMEAKEGIMDGVYHQIAEKFDRVATISSLTMNTVWKRRFVHRMQAAPGAKMLDVAGGTCEIAKHYLDYQDTVNKDKTSSVHVVDLNVGMLRVGMGRMAGTQWMKDGRITLAKGNAEDLAEIPDNSVDIYSISAGMHNIPHLEKALSEAYRVVRPGGTFACLEYGHVDTPVLGQIVRWYWDNGVPVVGQIFARDRAAYERLARSVRAFPHQDDFTELARSAGFHMPGKGYELFQCGMMVSYMGTKPRA
ncbi:2-hexaprenyl-6-methoxy-1,4-benzoquinone methyltransferase [Coemansia javaensis]|uniref:2-hexaprenyl-6-methoxy-1,4-benzoquinone methyltransferase n=1 Tax=Coemansia javaensis TaxID=2761396 RepID=A0A9W8HDE8_9FUNG|nr:2-hexaprenyl-6-methoxy-1,4-benzoquinone methyltransferase [Coemansia javaensis]